MTRLAKNTPLLSCQGIPKRAINAICHMYRYQDEDWGLPLPLGWPTRFKDVTRAHIATCPDETFLRMRNLGKETLRAIRRAIPSQDFQPINRVATASNKHRRMMIPVLNGCKSAIYKRRDRPGT